MLSLAAMAWLASWAAAGACAKDERELVRNPDLMARPFTTIASDADLTEACRRSLIDSLGTWLNFQLQTTLCVGAQCGDLADASKSVDLLTAGLKGDICPPRTCSGDDASCRTCAPRPDVLEVLSQADDALARALGSEMDVIEKKIAAGTVPSCLLPDDCPGAGCRASLMKTWWDDWGDPSNPKEKKTRAGGFAHLLLANAFTCGAGKQIGGTCTIYSGVSLLSHYCATPRFNPEAANSCTAQGPGFSCPTADQMLQAAGSDGVWKATRCVDDETADESRCEATPVNSKEKQEAKRQAAFAAACPPGNSGTPACRAMFEKLEKIRSQAGAQAVDAGADEQHKIGRSWVSGKEGADLEAFQKTLRRFGFSVTYFPPDEQGWNDALRSVDEGHPVQIAVNPGGWWAGYGPADSGHAIVIEGRWLDGAGAPWVLVRDSNFPNEIRLSPAGEFESKFIGYGGGAIGVCPPQFRSRCVRQSDPDEGQP
jgi:hypothetical protein